MDQHKRCTVGGFNWTPSVIDMETVDEVATISAQRHTALHETIHVRLAPPRAFSPDRHCSWSCLTVTRAGTLLHHPTLVMPTVARHRLSPAPLRASSFAAISASATSPLDANAAHPPPSPARALARAEQVLGGIKYKNLINGTTGERLRDSETVMKEVEDVGYPGKKMLKLTTPQVLRVAREQFGCETLEGIPLEDQPLGKDAHWEARIMGPEGELIVCTVTFYANPADNLT